MIHDSHTAKAMGYALFWRSYNELTDAVRFVRYELVLFGYQCGTGEILDLFGLSRR